MSIPPAPAEDVDLDAIIQETVRDICALSGDLVRPRWQPIAPKQPEQIVDWVAIGIISITSDAGPAIEHNPLGQGTDTYQRHDTIEVLGSFYGPHGQTNAALLRDGLAIPQNTEPLGDVAMRFVECGPIRQAHELVNTKWIKRQDMSLWFRRKVTRVYGIESLAIADVHLFDDTTVDETVIVPPTAKVEP